MVISKPLLATIVAPILMRSVDDIIDAPTLQDFGVHSLEMVEIISEFEDRFGISISLKESPLLFDLDNAVQFIQEKMAARAKPAR
jgi:acyl carrier protein